MALLVAFLFIKLSAFLIVSGESWSCLHYILVIYSYYHNFPIFEGYLFTDL